MPRAVVSQLVLRLGYRLNDQGSIHDKGWVLSSLYGVQTGPGAHPVSYQMGTARENFPG
jgi:hypothetical protein